MLDKHYNPSEIEARIHARWEETGAFASGRADRAGADTYCIVIPPPNVTGSLHMGHALNNTLQDILVRFERMRGKDVLWQPGTDHAGIATQMVVERQLASNGEPNRRALGREAFVDRIWQWKYESGGEIVGQLKRLGASCDWSRERFTMDAGLSEAVVKVFVELYREGLIYKDQRLVNWDPKFQTAISDLEVENREVDGHFWHFKYPLENGETYEFPIAYDEEGNPTEWETRDYISIATTRPETMLGDGAVAVHPSDARYAPIVGKRCLLPLADRYIPIITDEYPDPDFGSGAVKITGAHDFNDYEVARRNDIAMYVLMDERGHMVSDDFVPERYRGMDRFEARKAVVADIDERGLLIKVEDKTIMQPFGDRSGVVIEPMLTWQWYCNAEELAKPAIKAVEDGTTSFVPANWSKTYFEWMRNIQPWCISRQLWWGHQIPAWYGPDGEIFVAESEADAVTQAKAHYEKENVELRRDEDVLDTWFSSALWPFSTLGWPDETPELARYYKTDVLVTGFDIIFFWVARMMMMGLHSMKDEKGAPEVPFHTVYIHALVRDGKGQKMSKSKGNVLDPIDIVDGIELKPLVAKRTTGMMNPKDADRVAADTKKEFPDGIKAMGADALRFTLSSMAAQGRDIKLSMQRIDGYRSFATKLWNASRFCEMNECVSRPEFDPSLVEDRVNRWIVGETARAVSEIETAIEAYKFNEASSAVYRFVWNIFCDWYLELAKPVLNGADATAQAETRATAAWVLDQALKMLHPFMPFVTEELWERTADHGPARDTVLCLAPWPNLEGLGSKKAEAEVNWLIDVITAVRSVKNEMNVPASARLSLELVKVSKATRKRAERHEDTLCRLLRLDGVRGVKQASPGSLQMVVDGETIALPLEGVVDVAGELQRLKRECEKATGEMAKIDKKLGNEQFMAKAPDHVVEEQRERRADYEATAARLTDAIARMETLG